METDHNHVPSTPWFGILSIVLALLNIPFILFLNTVVHPDLIERLFPGLMYELPFWLISLIIPVAGIILAFVGIFREKERLVFSTIGLVLNILILIPIFFCVGFGLLIVE